MHRAGLKHHASLSGLSLPPFKVCHPERSEGFAVSFGLSQGTIPARQPWLASTIFMFTSSSKSRVLYTGVTNDLFTRM